MADGKVYPCIEILYAKRHRAPEKICIAVSCYVTLPKQYHIIEAAYGDFSQFALRRHQRLVYSFLMLPVAGASEASAMLRHLNGARQVVLLR